jgi:hypothetical protein
MPHKKLKTATSAAEQLASVIHGHLAGLPRSQRERNIRALEKSAATIGDSRAKSATPRETAADREADPTLSRL